jgi:hypothetical protein
MIATARGSGGAADRAVPGSVENSGKVIQFADDLHLEFAIGAAVASPSGGVAP